MKIKQLKVHNFGKLNNREITFEDGVNIVYGPNESGKTTLHEFMRAMFYGITRQRGRASKSDLYTRYEPWENSSYFAGVLRFESGGKDFRITRNFYKNDTREEFVCETDGERLSLEKGDMEVLLGDVSETVFDNTISIGQMRSRTDESLYQELRNYMTNYEGSGDWALDIQQALKSLKNQEKEYNSLQRSENAGLEARKQELQMNISYLQQEIAGYEDKATSAKNELAAMKADDVQAEVNVGAALDRTAEVPPRPKRSIFNKILFLSPILLVLAIELFFFDYLPVWARIVAGAIVVVAGILWWVSSIIDKNTPDDGWNNKKARNEQARSLQDQPIHTTTADVEAALNPPANDKRTLLEGRLAQLEEMHEEKKTQLDNCQMDYWEYTANTGEIDDNQVEIDALQLAMASIEEVSSTGTQRMEKQFHQRISDILKEITNGKYDRVVLDDSHEIELHSTEKQIPLWTLSKGTIEQVYFALRMAAAEIFCTEDMPILLDDVFTMYDEDRLAAALAWLVYNKKQVIIFTCNTREAEIVQKLNIKANSIRL